MSLNFPCFTGLLYLRARYYNPALGTFMSRDPFEGVADRAMSLNGYSWVEGNVVNAVDPSGSVAELSAFSYCITGQSIIPASVNPPRTPNTGLLNKVDEAISRICGFLCDFLTDSNFKGLDVGCKNRLKDTICPLLCNDGSGSQDEWNYAYKGVLQRFKEFIEDQYRLDPQGRQGHRAAYKETQDEFNREFSSWKNDCLTIGVMEKELEEFRQRGNQWGREMLPFIQSPAPFGPSPWPVPTPSTNGLQLICLPYGYIWFCGLAFCRSGQCTFIIIPPLG